MISLTKKEIYRHLLVWVLITTFICFLDPVHGTLFKQAIGTFLIMIAYMFVYYIELMYVFRIFYPKNKFIVLFFLPFVYLIYLTIDFLNFNYFLLEFTEENKLDINNIYDLILPDFVLFTIISIVAFGTYQNKVSLIIIEQQSNQEKTLLNRELGFYKNQFNSHITFNFLNYCYRFFYETSRDTADLMELYSEMLRYSINNKPNEVVKLIDDIDYLNKFIKLKKSLNKDIFINFKVIGDIENKYILPRILITFVENAFKHGEIHSSENPISIKLEVNTEIIVFEIINIKSTSKNKPISTGIGQLNLKKQLELFYKNSYQLIIKDEAEYYTASLKLFK